jgi:hypothetical protein
MLRCPTLLFALVIVASLASMACGQKHELVKSKDGQAIGYKTTPIQPWSGFHVHDPDRPLPKRVDPGPAPPPAAVPSDAVVLFDGKTLDAWKPHQWQLDDGLLVAGEGNLTSQAEFGACQLHLEWQAPAKPDENWGNCGNNGVMLLGLFEIQIYDSYTKQIYPDGQAASIYAQTPPLVNATRKPGEWQSFDIVLQPPAFDGDKLVEPARITMHHNGVLVHHHQEVYGGSPHLRLAPYGAPVTRGPIILMGHHCPVKFRNIWVRKLEAD